MKNESGLTLPEVLISVAILAIGAVYVLRALSSISYAQALNESQVASYAFTASKLAELEASLASGSEQKKQSGSFRNANEEKFDWRLDFGSYNQDLKLNTASLDVEWKNDSRAYSYNTKFLVPEPKPNDSKTA